MERKGMEVDNAVFDKLSRTALLESKRVAPADASEAWISEWGEEGGAEEYGNTIPQATIIHEDTKR